MNPEKEIVIRYLQSHGFFTICNLNAGPRTIDIIAISMEGTKISSIKHVEIHCQLSAGASPKERQDLMMRFEDPLVVKTVETAIKRHIGIDCAYEKMLVTTSGAPELKGISAIKFEDVLIDVISRLDKQNYRNDVLRTIQLVKHTVLSNPRYANKLLLSGDQGAKRGRRKDAILRGMFSSEHARLALRKKSGDQVLLEMLRNSPHVNTEKVLTALAEEILSSRAKTFLSKKIRPIEKAEEKEPIRKELSLEQFYN